MDYTQSWTTSHGKFELEKRNEFLSFLTFCCAFSLRNSFHIFLLRQCVPRMRIEEATGIGLAAIKSWSCVSYLPCRESDWLNHATVFLSEAFAKYDDTCNASFLGSYVHSPLVRLEALKSLVTDRGNKHQQYIDSASVATSISGDTSGTGLSGSIPMLSLFTLTRCVHASLDPVVNFM